MELDLKSLVNKLNPTCRRALEGAAQMCVAQTHYNVEIEHFLMKLLDFSDTDIHRVFRHYDIQPADVVREMVQTMDGFKRGSSRTPGLSPHLLQLVQEAWTLTSLQFGEDQMRSGFVLLALVGNDALRVVMAESAPSLRKIPLSALQEELSAVIRHSGEQDDKMISGEKGAPSKTPALDQYTVDLTAQAEAGTIDPVVGRDTEIRQIVDILTRRRQNNPILTGEAGVGKTAIVEGFALRMTQDDVPPPLKKTVVRALDLGLLQAGAGVRGEFEDRLKSVIAEVKASPRPIILFIDEAHALIGAGGQAGQGDAANLLKPALARGELRTIAATTWSEYKQYIEKDPALTRRFQVVPVDEPSEEAAEQMLRGVMPTLEDHHQVRILDEAVAGAVRLSHRYITGRQLPDKGISVLDTACARVAIGQTGVPPQVEDAVRRLERLEQEISILEREQATGGEHEDRIEELRQALDKAGRAKERLEVRWQKEQALVKQIRELEGQLETQASREAKGAEERRLEQVVRRGKLSQLKTDLGGLQGNEPMVPTCVDFRTVASVISGWTGIPLGKMLTDEIDTILHLQEEMTERIVGQSEALETISKRIQTSRADLEDPGKPTGVFLLVGSSGVGKTETAVTLADLLYGGERNMVSINMSEYQEAHTVSSLKGAPPGYVGYGTGGVLTEAVRRNPYSVVLLDEVEKAHPDVMELFYQVFDKGTLEDGEGVTVDFKNTIILLTSNVGSEHILEACQDGRPDVEDLAEQIRPELLRHFKPAFLGRLIIVPYYPLRDREIRKIVRLKLCKLQERIQDNHRAVLQYGEGLVEAVGAQCTEIESGARNIDSILTHTLLPELSATILERMARGEGFSRVQVSLNAEGGFAYAFDLVDDLDAEVDSEEEASS